MVKLGDQTGSEGIKRTGDILNITMRTTFLVVFNIYKMLPIFYIDTISSGQRASCWLKSAHSAVLHGWGLEVTSIEELNSLSDLWSLQWIYSFLMFLNIALCLLINLLLLPLITLFLCFSESSSFGLKSSSQQNPAAGFMFQLAWVKLIFVRGKRWKTNGKRAW